MEDEKTVLLDVLLTFVDLLQLLPLLLLRLAVLLSSILRRLLLWNHRRKRAMPSCVLWFAAPSCLYDFGWFGWAEWMDGNVWLWMDDMISRLAWKKTWFGASKRRYQQYAARMNTWTWSTCCVTCDVI